MLRVFAAGLQCETNTYSPFVAGLHAFEEGGMLRGAEALAGQGADHAAARQWQVMSERDGHVFTPSLFALAHPSGPTVHATYEVLRDEILRDLRAAGGADVVLLFLHGAMVTTEWVDCQVDLACHVRRVVGDDAVIGIELDPHCYLEQALLDAADVVLLMKEYPHDDFVATAQDLYRICIAARHGAVKPVSALFDCRMVGFYPTTAEPMASLVAAMRAAEQEPGMLSVSFVHGFPWGDMPSAGSRVLAIADGDAELATATARRIGLEIYGHRHALLPNIPSADDALTEALATPGLVVIADMGDNPGGGAPGDNVALLRRMRERGITSGAVGGVWDPMVAQMCAEAGAGTSLQLRLGGKTGAASGEPLDVRAIVRSVSAGHTQLGLGGSTVALGMSAWIEVDDIHVVVVSVRTQTFDPSLFTRLGLDLSDRKIVVVKSSQHFYTRFQPIAARIVRAATPGALNMDFARLDYVRKRDQGYFPRQPDPLQAGEGPFTS